MTFAKPTVEKYDDQNAEQRLMCSVFGCPEKWSVRVDASKPMCSRHMWASQDEWYLITKEQMAKRALAQQAKEIEPPEGSEF
jgi:hypothetical protein